LKEMLKSFYVRCIGVDGFGTKTPELHVTCYFFDKLIHIYHILINTCYYFKGCNEVFLDGPVQGYR